MSSQQPIYWKDPKFLKLNGIWVCVSDSNTRRQINEIGSRDRTYLGRYYKDKIKNKYTYQFQTVPMHPRRAVALEHIINGDGESYPFEEDFYSVKGRGPSFTTITPQYYIESEGVSGRYAGGALYPHYNNNISDVIDTAGTAASWFTNDGGNVSEADEATDGYYNSGCTELTFLIGAGALGTSYTEIEIDAASLDSVDYVVSFWMKLDRVANIGSEFGIAVRDNTSVLASTYGDPDPYPAKPNPYEWTRYELAFTTNSTLEPLFLQIGVNPDSYGGLYSSTIVFIDGIMLETPPSPNASPFRTSGIDGGSHPVEVDWSQHYDGFTVSFFARVTDEAPSALDGNIFDLRTLPGTDIYFVLNRESSIPEITFSQTGSSLGMFDRTLIDMFDDTEYHMFSMVYRRYLAYGEQEFQLFYDGTIVDSFSPGYDGFDQSLIERLTLLGDTDKMQFSDVQVLNFPVDEQVIYDWFMSEVKQGIAPKILAEGLFEKRQSVEVIGEVTNIEYVSAHIEGEFVNNAAVLTFNLHEV